MFKNVQLSIKYTMKDSELQDWDLQVTRSQEITALFWWQPSEPNVFPIRPDTGSIAWYWFNPVF